jgi:phosphopantothenate synthetase
LAPSPQPDYHVEPEPKTRGNGEVFRWVIGSVPSESAMRRLHAACILAEGEIPIRIVNRRGDILVGESENILVDPSKFKIVVELFGI